MIEEVSIFKASFEEVGDNVAFFFLCVFRQFYDFRCSFISSSLARLLYTVLLSSDDFKNHSVYPIKLARLEYSILQSVIHNTLNVTLPAW